MGRDKPFWLRYCFVKEAITAEGKQRESVSLLITMFSWEWLRWDPLGIGEKEISRRDWHHHLKLKAMEACMMQEHRESNLNLDRLRLVLGDDIELHREIIDLYLADSRKRLAEMHAALNRQDLETLRRQAHAIKGSSGNVGAERVQQAALTLENMAREVSSPNLDLHLARVQEEFNRAAVGFTEYLNSR